MADDFSGSELRATIPHTYVAFNFRDLATILIERNLKAHLKALMETNTIDAER